MKKLLIPLLMVVLLCGCTKPVLPTQKEKPMELVFSREAVFEPGLYPSVKITMDEGYGVCIFNEGVEMRKDGEAGIPVRMMNQHEYENEIKEAKEIYGVTVEPDETGGFKFNADGTPYQVVRVQDSDYYIEAYGDEVLDHAKIELTGEGPAIEITDGETKPES